MKKVVGLLLLIALMSSGCAYERAYIEYAKSQADMAKASGALFKQSFTPDGKVASFEVGNPMTAMAMMQMKAPKSEWESFMDWLKVATPFAAIWGVVGSMSNSVHGNVTNVAGDGNLTGNAAGPAGGASHWASPVTTTTTTETYTISGGTGSME